MWTFFADDEVTDEELLGAATALTAEASTSAVFTASANSSSSSANVVVDDSSFHRMFEAANRAAFSSIVSDTKLNLSPMSQTVLITAHRLLPHCDELCNNDNVINCLRGVFVGRVVVVGLHSHRVWRWTLIVIVIVYNKCTCVLSCGIVGGAGRGPTDIQHKDH